MKKYKLWWLCCVGVALFFGVGSLCRLAFGVTYLYAPVTSDGAEVAYLVFQGAACAVAWFIAAVAASDYSHLKGKQ